MSNLAPLDEKIILKEEDFTKTFNLDPSFKFIKKSNDPRFGEVKLHQNPETKAVIAVREIRLNDKKQAEKEIIKCQKRLRLVNQYILPVINYSIEKQSSLCSSFYLLKLYYEYPPTDLKREMTNREKNNQKFTGEELLHILYQQIEAHKYLELTRDFHGDVRPIHWGLNSHLWHSKLIHKPEDIDSKQRILQVQLNHLQHGDEIYQSPAMYENLMAKNLKYDFSPNKEDMFATALILIELGIRESIGLIYRKDGKFDHEVMRKLVAQFESLYKGPENQLLVTAVLTMLEPEEKKRPHFILLHDHMPSYYSVAEYYDFLKTDPGRIVSRPVERFIYIDQHLIEIFTFETGVKQDKGPNGLYNAKNDVFVNAKYSDRNITVPDLVKTSNYIGNGKIIERIIRRFEERDGQMIEKVEHFDVKDNNIMVKTEEYELVNNKRFNVKYFDSDGTEIVHENNINEGHENDKGKKSVDVKVKAESKIDKNGSRNSSINKKDSKNQKRGSDFSHHNKSIDKHKKDSFNKLKSHDEIDLKDDDHDRHD